MAMLFVTVSRTFLFLYVLVVVVFVVVVFVVVANVVVSAACLFV